MKNDVVLSGYTLDIWVAHALAFAYYKEGKNELGKRYSSVKLLCDDITGCEVWLSYEKENIVLENGKITGKLENETVTKLWSPTHKWDDFGLIVKAFNNIGYENKKAWIYDNGKKIEFEGRDMMECICRAAVGIVFGL